MCRELASLPIGGYVDDHIGGGVAVQHAPDSAQVFILAVANELIAKLADARVDA